MECPHAKHNQLSMNSEKKTNDSFSNKLPGHSMSPRGIKNMHMNSTWKSVLFSFFFISALLASAQEICDNGIDDDGDGLIDCYDGECANDGACDDFYFGNAVVCADEIDVTTFAIRQQWGSEDQSANSHATPMVGDLDGNGIPEVVTTNKQNKSVFILNGATGATIGSAFMSFQPENAPVLGDVDGDEFGEILVSQDQGDDMIMYNHDLTILWSGKSSRNDAIGLPGLADFDEDGDVEIYYRNEIVDAATGNIIVTGTNSDWERNFTHGSLAVDVLPDAFCADCAGLELVSGNEIWAINEAAGTRTLAADMDDDIHSDINPLFNYYPKYYSSWDDQWSTVSAADYNLDGNIDLIITGALGTAAEQYNGETTIFFWDVTNNNVITYHDNTNNFVRGPGRVNIGDVDGDGQLNANFVMNQKLYSLDENFNIHWIHPIKEGSSGFTGCSLFDFDGDGAVEVVYRSEESLLVVDGVGNGDNTTFERNEIACVSRTQEEYPVIADVDGDGASEICVTCYFNNNTPFNPYSNSEFAHVRVFESDGEAWMPARGVWNQHGYYNVNINDDLTIPTEVQDHSIVFSAAGTCEYSDGSTIPYDNRPLNTFINQAPILNEDGCVEFASPDIDFIGIVSASDALCPDAEITVEFQITNTGDIGISGNLPVSYYAGDPTADPSSSVLLDTEVTFLTNFEVGETATITQTIAGVGGDYELFVVINDAGGTPPLDVPLPTATIPECETGNNIQSTLIGSQTFDLTVEKLNDNRKCDPAKPDNGSARAYYFGPAPGPNENIWVENFQDRTNGAQSDADDTGWTSDGGTESPSFYGVSSYSGSQMFEATGTGTSNDVGVVTWTSEDIDISNYTDISITVDIFENGNQESSGKWRDWVRVSYELRDAGNNVIESNQLGNGYQDGDFTYAQALVGNLSPDGSAATLTIVAEIHNTSSSEHHYIDNIIVNGTGPDVTAEYTEPDGFVFRWYNDDDYSSVLYEGSQFPQMATGTYDVVGYYGATECYSDTVELTINLINTPSFNVHVYEISPLTECSIPDGSLGAFAYTSVDGGGIPQDTLTTADGYDFTWFIQSEGVTPIATGDVASNLDAIGYTVEVTEDFSGCTVSESRTVSTSVSNPPDPNVTITHITTCGGTGQLAADVSGNTADYTFEWYDGPSIKPAPDFTGDTYTVSDQGQYTVTATLNSSGCTSNSVTVTLNDNSIAPTPGTYLVQDNTSCVAGNGIVRADGDGGGAVSGYTFEWFLGANTLPANTLPGTAAPGAFLVSDNPYELGGLEEGTYTVRVTEDATSCFETRTIDVTDNPGSLSVTPGNLIQNDINSCNPAALGSIDASGVVSGDVNDVSIGNINSSFENLDILTNNDHIQSFDGGNIKTYQQDFIDGWSTTAPDQRIEIWHNNNSVSGGIHDAYHGDQFAEINANSDAALYFDLATVPGSLLNWSFAHKGRSGTDELSVNIGEPGAEVVQGNFSTGNGAWAFYQGQYTIPADQFTTRFQFEAVSTAGGNNSVGNFVDTVSFVLFPYRFELFEGTVASGTADYINTTGQFGNLDEGDYVLVVYDNLTGCGAVEIPFTIDRDQTQPAIATTVTDDAHCDNDAGSVDVTASMSTSEPASYTYEIFDGHSFTTQIGPDETVADGSVPFTFTNLAPGDYRIRVTNDDTQCTDFEDIVVDDVTVIPTYSTSQVIDNSSCDPGNPNGFLSVSIQGDVVSNYSFTWWQGTDTSVPAFAGPSTGGSPSDGEFLSGLSAGDYTVVAENIATGCETVELTLTVSDDPYIPNIVITEDAPQTDCGTGNGQLSAYVDNNPDFAPGVQDVSGFSFQWYFDGAPIVNGNPLSNGTVNPQGATSPVLTNLVAGEYTVEVTHDDPSGSETDCSATETFVLTENQVFPVVTLNSTQPNTGCDVTTYDGEILVDVAPAGTYDFDWFYSNGTPVSNGGTVNGSDTNNLTGVVDDTYKVVATSTLQCTSDTLVVVLNANPAVISVNGVIDQQLTVCVPSTVDPNGQITVNPSTAGGEPAGGYDIQWYFGSGTSNTLDAADLTDPDALGGTSIAGIDGPTGLTVTGLEAGTYTVEIINVDTQCPVTEEFTIVDNSTNPTFNNPAMDVAAVDMTDCAGGLNYPNGGVTIDLSAITGSGNYTVNYFYGGSALPANQLTVDGSTDIFAEKGTAGSANINIQETTDNTTSASVTGLNPGDYTIEVIDNGTGCTTAEVTVTVDAVPAVISVNGVIDQQLTVCVPSTVDPNGQITVNPSTAGGEPAGGYDIQWYFGSGTSNTLDAADLTDPDALGGTSIAGIDGPTGLTVTGLEAGTYTVEIINVDTQCPVTEEFTIVDNSTNPTFNNPAVDVAAVDMTDCAGGLNYPNGGVTIDLSAITGSGNYTVNYFYGGSALPANQLTVDGSTDIFAEKGTAGSANINIQETTDNTTSASVTGLNPGDYTIEVIDNGTGCTTAEVTVTVDAVPAVISVNGVIDQQLTVCVPSTVDPNGQITVNPSTAGGEPAGGYDIQWYFGSGTSNTLDAADLTDPDALGGTSIAGIDGPTGLTVTGLEAGTYTVEIINVDTQCPVTEEFTIVDNSTNPTFNNPAVDVAAVDMTDCAGGLNYPNGGVTIDLSAITGSGNYTVNYFYGGSALPANQLTVDGSTDIFAEKGTAGSANINIQETTDNTTSASVTGLNPGDYTIEVIDNGTGCTTSEVTVTVDAVPAVISVNGVIDQQLTVCVPSTVDPNGQITVNPSTAGGEPAGGYDIQWYFGSGTSNTLDAADLTDPDALGGTSIAGIDGPTGLTVTGLEAGTYTVEIINVDTQCPVTEEFTIVDNSTNPTFNNPAMDVAAVDMTDCAGGLNYPNGGVTIDLSAITGSGNYTVNYFYGGSALPANQLTVDGSTDIFAEKGTAGSANINIQETTDNTTSASVTGLNPGDYTIEVIDNGTGCTTAEVTVTVDAVPAVISVNGVIDQQLTVCVPSTVDPNGQITVNPSTAGGEPAGGYDIQWYFGSGTSNTLDAADLTDPDALGGTSIAGIDGPTGLTVTGLEAGTYTVEIINVDTQCPVTEEFTIVDNSTNPTFNNPAVDVAAVDMTDCAGGLNYPNGGVTIDLSAITGSGNYTVNYFYGGSALPANQLTVDGSTDIFAEKGTAGSANINIQETTDNTTSASVTGLNPGDYTIEVIDNGTGCTTAEVTVTVDAVPAVISVNGVIDQQLTVCVPSTVDPNGQITVNPSTAGGEPAGGYDIQWYFGSGTSNTLDAADLTDPDALGGTSIAGIDGPTGLTVTGLEAGTYTVEIINVDTQCPVTEEFTIVDNSTNPTFNNPAVDVAAVDMTDCAGGLNYPNGGVTIDLSAITGSGNYTVNYFYGGSALPANQLTVDGSTDIFAEKGTAGSANINIQETTDNTTSASVTGLNPGDYTIEVIDNGTGCTTSEVTVTVDATPVTFTPAVTINSNQTSCDLTSPNGQLTASIAVGASTDLNDYNFQWFAGQNTNPANEILAGLSGTNNSTVSNLAAGIYTLLATEINSNCDASVETTVVLDNENPNFSLDLVNVNTRCDTPDGSISFTIDPDGDSDGDAATSPFDGAAGYTVELFDGATIGATETPLQTLTANDGVQATFNNLLDGTYSIRATDNNTDCVVEELNIVVNYSGVTASFDPSLFFEQNISACFDNDGIIDVGTGITVNNDYNNGDAITIIWYAGTDTSDVNDQLSNLHNVNPSITNPIDMEDITIADGDGDNITIVNGRIGDNATTPGSTSGLPAISYTGVAILPNGCIEVFSTSLTFGAAPDVTIASVDPTRCATAFDGQISITLDAQTGNNPAQYRYYVFEGSQSIQPDSDGSSPYDPALSTYAPIAASGAATGLFTDATDDATELIDFNDNAALGQLPAGTYTIGVDFFDGGAGDNCIVFVGTVTLNDPEEPDVTIDAGNTINNSICDVSGALDYNGQITVDAIHNSLGGTFDFTWYYDSDGDGDFTAGQTLIDADGADEAGVGSNVVGFETLNANSATISGIGAGWYRVIATHNDGGSIPPATACPDTLDIQLFDELVTLSVGSSAGADWTISHIENCTDNGAFTLMRILQDGAVDPASDTEAEIQADFTLTWNNLTTASTFVPNVSETEADNLAAGDYRIDIESDLTGCVTSYQFTIQDNTIDPVISLNTKSPDTYCDGVNNIGDGSVTVNITEDGGAAITLADYSVEWYRGTYTVAPGLADPDFLHDDAGSGSGANVGSALVGGDIRTLTDLENGTYTVFINKDNGDVSGNGNEGCQAFATFTIGSDQPTLTVNLATGVTVVDNDNCTPADGSITIDEIIIDGVATPLNNASPYTINWTAIGGGVVGTSGAGAITDDQLTGVNAGTYSFFIQHNTTGCATGTIDVEIEDLQVNPVISLNTKSPDTYCDGVNNIGDGSVTVNITEDGGAAITLADYSVEWYRGTYTVAPGLADPDFLHDDAGSGSGANVGSALVGGDIRTLTDLENGTYTVFINKDNGDVSGNGNEGCQAFATFTIGSDQPTLTVNLATGVTVVDNDNCTPADGSITIDEIIIDGVATPLNNASPYTINWTAIGGGVVGTSGAGAITDDQLTGVNAGTYSFFIQHNTTGCATGTIDVEIEDLQVNPVISLNTKSPDTYCDGVNNIGDGSVTVNITEDGGAAITLADYSVEWYRGTYTVAPGLADPDFLHDDAGSGSGANVGSALVGGDIRTLTDLENGTYTVFINKDNGDVSGNGNEGCQAFATFTIGSDQPTLTVNLATGVTVVDNDNCTPADGSITIDEIIIDGVATPLNNASPYTINWTAIGGGVVGTSGAGAITDDQLTGVNAGTYSFFIQHNTTGCATGTIDVEIEDLQVNPVISLNTKSPDTYCDGVNNIGDGSVTVNITEDGGAAITLADYSVEWYRGTYTVAPGLADPDFLHDDAGSGSGANVGSALVGGDIRTLTDLENGTYTVFINKDNGDVSGNGNEGCQAFATFTIGSDQPTLTVNLATGVTVVDNDNCTPADGSITIDEIIIDGVATPLNNASPYTINWTAIGGGVVGTSGAGAITDDQLTGVNAGTYSFFIQHNTTGCATGTIDVEIEDLQVNPVISLNTKSPDTYCDGVNNIGDGSVTVNITEDGGAAITLADYSVEWYRGTYTVAPGLADPDFLHDDAGSGSGANVGSALVGGDIRTLTDLENGTYTVFINKDNGDVSGNGNEGCQAFATFTIGSDQPTLTVNLATGVTVVDNDNCTPADGSITIDEIIIDGVATPLNNASPYTINWTAIGGGVVGTSGAGAITDDQLTGVNAGTYSFFIQHNTTGCATGTIDVEIEDLQVNPVISLNTKSPDTYCDGVNNIGDGSVTVNITEDGGAAITLADYSVEWYRGTYTVAPGLADPDFLHDDAGSGSGANVGSALVGGDIRTLTDLENGTYTVFINKDNGDVSGNGNEGCQAFATFTIGSDQPTLTVNLATGVTVVDNDNCTPADGSITIDEIIIDGVATPLNNASPYTINWTAIGGGVVGTSGAGAITDDQLTGVNAGTYSFFIQHNTTGCATGTIDVEIEDLQVNPVISGTSTEDTYCDNTGDVGDGTLSISIDDEGPATTADFTITWYRGTIAPANEIFPADGGSRGVTAGANADLTSLTGLATGDYTVVITKDLGDTPGTGNEGCSATAVFNVGSMDNIPTIDAAAIQASTEPDSLCTGNSGTLIINDADVSTGDLGDFEIRIYTGAVGVGELAGSPYTNTAATSISYTTLAGNDYYITAENTTTGCFAATAIVNVKDSVRNPQVTLVSMTPDEDCGGGVDAGALQVIIDSQFDDTDHFDVQWFTGFGTVGGNEIGGETAVTLTGYAAGQYSVSVRNQNTDCTISRDYTITNVPIYPSITDFATGENNICDDDMDNNPVDVGTFELLEATFDGATLNQAAMAGNYQLEVYDDFGLTSPTTDGDGDPTNFIYTELSAGTYYAIVRKLDSDCPSEPLEFDIVDNVLRPQISIALQAADSTCAAGGTPEGALRATATVGMTSGIDDTDPDYTFQWYYGSGTGTPLANGVDPGNGSTPAGVATSDISGLAADTYTVEVTRISTGCVTTAEFELPNVPTNVEIQTVSVVDATNCTPGNGTITVTAVNRDNVADYIFDYYDVDPTVGSPAPVFTVPTDGAVFNTASAGVYYIIGTNTIVNCTTPIFEVEVGENLTYPEIVLDDFDFQTNCDPDNPNGRLLVLADGTVAGYTFEWFLGDIDNYDPLDPLSPDDFTWMTGSTNPNLAGQNTNEVSGLPAFDDGGTPLFYTVEVTNNTTNCISVEDFQMADDVPNPIAISTSTSANTNCASPNGKMAASVITLAPGRSISDYSFYWWEDDGAADTSNPGTADFTGSLVENRPGGNYLLVVVDDVDSFCESEVIQVTIEDATTPPTYTLETRDVTVCFDDKDGFASVSVPDLSSVDIAWYDDASNPIGTTFYIDSLDAGMYTLELTHVITGCTATEVFEILNNAVTPNAPTVIVNNGRNNCSFANGSAIANVDGITNNFLFEWFDPDDMNTPYATGSEVFNLDTATYLVRATNLATGCESPMTSVEIGYEVVDPEYEVIFNNSVCLRTEDGSTNQFTGTAVIQFDEFNLATDYEWRDSNGTLVGTDSRLIDAYPGDYFVTFTAENGCSYEASFTIETSLTIYNGVSANADGKNDFFLVDCIDYFPNNNVKIYNRAGQRLFEVDGYNNTDVRFEGFSNVGGGGLQLPAGTYFYIIDLGNGEDPVQGFLELVR